MTKAAALLLVSYKLGVLPHVFEGNIQLLCFGAWKIKERLYRFYMDRQNLTRDRQHLLRASFQTIVAAN